MSSSPVRLTFAAACTAALLCASGASAATLHGTVVGQAKTAHGRAVVPVLLSAASAKAAGGAIAKVSAPVSKGIRTTDRSIQAADLRVGDRVKASVGHITKTARVSVLRITRRGSAPSFSQLAASRASALTSAQAASSSVDQIKRNPLSTLNPDDLAKTDTELRTQLLAVRYGLNVLIMTLRSNADGVSAAVATIQREVPADAGRKAATEAQEHALLADLGSSADSSRQVAQQLEDAVAALDQYINTIGLVSSTPAPLNEVGAVSDVLHGLLDLLRTP